ncbi:hypothetical protein [Reichenbachiella sp.]|uniref:hypothetical protein n=1 Tax=Reichenbachiella sp. TaxID=2184521 RepID=UPI003BAF5385
MKKITPIYNSITLFIVLGTLLSCSGTGSRFPMEKRFWTPEDYENVFREIRFNTPEGERFPELKNPETSTIFKKLVDRDNFEAVLGDDQLGINHRNNVASDFFNVFRQFTELYYKTDRQDKFVYGRELIEIYKFGLDLQIYYFKIGNDNILKEADDPSSSSVKNVIASNVKTVYKNFNNYLDYTNNESGFSEDAIIAYCEGLDNAFPKLFETFPSGNPNITKKKAELMYKKAQNDKLKNSLQKLLDNIAELQSI